MSMPCVKTIVERGYAGNIYGCTEVCAIYQNGAKLVTGTDYDHFEMHIQIMHPDIWRDYHLMHRTPADIYRWARPDLHTFIYG